MQLGTIYGVFLFVHPMSFGQIPSGHKIGKEQSNQADTVRRNDIFCKSKKMQFILSIKVL